MSWTSLISTLLGGLLALGGSWLGQWWTERRAVAREKRAQEHERVVWARSLRYEAHLAFLKEFDDIFNGLYDHFEDGGSSGVPEEHFSFLWEKLEVMRIVSNDDTTHMAGEAIKSLQSYSGDWAPVQWTRDRYLGTVRSELQLPPIKLMGD
ncbi:hypothetical protein [Actinomadura violacea]|uniref:Uncharacterized protein n=1 Tax=Actinomadura violacea TaxID=2819934 RepID=A0ABS3RIM4_9ACTN|nr:hypothetical protein [Actinomadura violacea]MBO2456581.1 hypothetical protein [Actinomadura violacea]